ncbi:MAG: putative DNA-binding domain-containing protein [Betaproteobacteria bacterium]|nr:putative DNA-binding domain-containing protein [Betaproteobacteria bacterium]
MPSLRELQLKFVATLLDPAGNYATAHVIDNAIPAHERIGVYRNNVISNFRQTLRAVYPVIERLVGARFFDRAADRYMRVHPSASGDLNRFGETFADFLDTWPPAREPRYLADVARLEWLVEESFHATDRESLRPTDLAAVPPDRQTLLTFDLHPSCRLLVSAYPIHRIWQVNQPDAPDDASVDLAEGGVFLLVRRHGREVAIETLDRGGFCMFSLFAAGRNFDEALRYSVSVQPDFDVAAFLQRHVFGGAFAGFDWPLSCSDETADGDSQRPFAAAA